jgi:hypothetical protein
MLGRRRTDWVSGVLLFALGVILIAVEAVGWAGFHQGARPVRGGVTHTRRLRKSLTHQITVDFPPGSQPSTVTVEGLFYSPADGTPVEVMVNDQHRRLARLPGWRGMGRVASSGVFALLVGLIVIAVDLVRRRRESN